MCTARMEMLVFSPVTEPIAKLFGYASYGVPQRKRPGAEYVCSLERFFAGY